MYIFSADNENAHNSVFNFKFSICNDCRLRAAGKANADGVKKSRPRERVGRGVPVPEANAELQANIDVCLIRHLIV